MWSTLKIVYKQMVSLLKHAINQIHDNITSQAIVCFC